MIMPTLRPRCRPPDARFSTAAEFALLALLRYPFLSGSEGVSAVSETPGGRRSRVENFEQNFERAGKKQ
jgi:hypothetical protein